MTEQVPKAVFPMLDVPLGAFGLSRLLPVCQQTFVNVDARVAAAVQVALTPMAPPGRVTFSPESPEPFGTAGTLVSLQDRFQETVLTWNADTITDIDLAALLESHRSSGAVVTIAVTPVQQGGDVTYEDGRATSFIDRRVRPEASGGQFIGVAAIERFAITALPHEKPLGLAEALVKPLTERGEVGIYEHHGYAADVGTFPRYLEASIDLLEGGAPQPPLALPGDIVQGDEGVAYIGPGATAAAGTLGASAILLRGSKVEQGASVERAVVWAATVVGEDETVRNRVRF